MSDFLASPTPNPNSLRLVRRDGRPVLPPAALPGGMLNATRPDDAADVPVALALLSIPGVAGVFAMAEFLTVTRTPGASWDALLQAVEAALDTV